ncbi:MAG TPA: type II toxin-antitoxin system VapB family antitoxin [Rugosimonospora sp.]|nr:type II toxin-antitoxin system VapB family antitoxin [Rugosimonospora sp.]
MAKTVIDIDENLLVRAQKILGTPTKKETVNAAMREIIRRAAVEQFIEMGHSGAFRDLADPDIMAQAWR